MNQISLWAVLGALAIPSVLAIIGILLNQSGLHRIDGRMDRLEGRMDRMMDVWHNDVQGLLGHDFRSRPAHRPAGRT